MLQRRLIYQAANRPLNQGNSSYEVFTVGTGTEDIARAEQNRPHLTFVDLSLAGIDGSEAARLLRPFGAVSHSSHCLAVSAHAMAGDEVRALDSTCVDYISKPLDEDVLFANLRRSPGPTKIL